MIIPRHRHEYGCCANECAPTAIAGSFTAFLLMKAIVYTKYGSPNVLELKETEKPVPNKNEVLIKVHATTVNRTDCATIRAKPFFMRIVTGAFKPKKKIPGTEFSGKIEAIACNGQVFLETNEARFLKNTGH